MNLPADPFFWLAVVTIAVVTGTLMIIGLAMKVGASQIDRDRKRFPRGILFLINSFYQPMRALARRLGRDERIIQRIGVDLYNHVAREEYASVSAEGRIIVIPHCLRDLKCPAKTDPIAGLLCVRCGRCGIGPFTEKAERHAVKTYVVNGSSFVRRVVAHYQPEAVFGVACTRDLFEVMRHVNGKGIPMVGTLLKIDGCVSTDVNWSDALAHFVIGLPPLPEDLVAGAASDAAVEPTPAETIAQA
ncbi:MAG: DUF116 domain-containing protein [Thermoplasmata archaeon]|nr:DUF116 domain-containing protein [Thermoplasmata archaeon]